MIDLWRRTLVDLRDRFRKLHKLELPAYHILCERIGVPGRPYRPLPAVLPNLRCRADTFGTSQAHFPLEISKWKVTVPNNRMSFSDESGKVWAVLSYDLLNQGELRCDEARQLKQFEAIARDAGSAIICTPPEIVATFPESIRDLCRPQPSFKRFKFGTIENEPKTWQGERLDNRNAFGVLSCKEGVLVDWIFEPAGTGDSDSHWMLFLHRLAWLGFAIPRLNAVRWCWGPDDPGTTVQYELVHERNYDGYDFVETERQRVDPTQWYSVLGDKTPLDVFDASARAIDILMEYAMPVGLGIAQPSTEKPSTTVSGTSLTARQNAIVDMLAQLGAGDALQGKQIAAKLPEPLRKDEKTLRRHDFPSLIKSGHIVSTPGRGYHLPGR